MIVGLIVMVWIATACNSQNGLAAGETKEEKERREMEQKAYEEAEKEYNDAVKRHYQMQSESTLRMMRNAQNQQAALNKSRSRSWDEQLFNSSCFRNSCFVKTGHTQLNIRPTTKVVHSPFVK